MEEGEGELEDGEIREGDENGEEEADDGRVKTVFDDASRFNVKVSPASRENGHGAEIGKCSILCTRNGPFSSILPNPSSCPKHLRQHRQPLKSQMVSPDLDLLHVRVHEDHRQG